MVDIYRAAKLYIPHKLNKLRTYNGKGLIQRWTSQVSIKGCPNSGKRFFIVKCPVSPSCRQIKLLQALVKLLRCHFLNGLVEFLLLLKPS